MSGEAATGVGATAPALAVEGFRLSPPQRLLWRRIEAFGAAPFTARARVAIAGPLDPARLAAAWRRLAARHELLRTSFRRLPAVTLPLQVIAAPGEVEPELSVRDLSGLAPEASTVALAALAALWDSGLDVPTDLAAPPLARALLATLSGERSILFVAASALLGDAPGLVNLIADLAAQVRDLEGDLGPADLDDPLQYADLSEWQWELLEAPDSDDGRAHWARAAQPAAGEPALPVARPAAGAYAPRRMPLRLAPAVARALAARPDRGDLLLAAWRGFLARWAGRAEVAVAFDGRKFAELATAPGLFARTIPVVGAVDLEATLDEEAQRVAEALADHRDWQEYLPAIDDADSPPAPLPFAFEVLPAPVEFAAGSVSFTVERAEARLEPALARLLVGGGDGGGDLALEVDSGRLAESDAERLADGFLAFLGAALAAEAAPSAGLPIAALPIVGDRERRRLLAAGAGPRIDFARSVDGPLALHRLVAAQAAATPDRIAVAGEGSALSFGALHARARRLAGALAGVGVGAESIVAIAVERSPELVVAILGVLEAGAAWLPLDPDYPRERLDFMLADSGARAIVLGAGAPDDLAVERWEGLPRLDLRALDPRALDLRALDLSTPERAEESGGRADDGADPAALAYVIYTSGSTGQPKGTLVSHGAIANRLLWMRDAFPLGATDAVLHKTPASFDASIWEIFLPLISGARIELAGPGDHRDARAMVEAVARRRIAVLQLVPSMLGPFLSEAGEAAEAVGGARRGLPRRLFCGGEALPATLAARSRALLGCEVTNLYGPTEAAIDATFHPATAGDAEGLTVPIGRPLDNVRIALLDEGGGLVPEGAPGEVRIGGAGLARGYLGRPDLTALRFGPDPTGTAAGERLYATGDLARLRPDGALEFLGRIDGQVKVRGVRVELGEIESVLAAHPDVVEAAVALRDDTGDPRLVAYVVARAPGRSAGSAGATASSPSTERLAEHLAVRLPAAMLPSAFVLLPALPRLPNGKVDRAALPAPSAPARAGAGVAPRTPTEEVLAARWAEVLGVERLGVFDNVFDLGWHSLLATQFASKLRRTFGVDLPLRALFEHPTVAALAERIDDALRGDPALAPPPFVAVPRGGPLPLSFAQSRLWFLDRLEPGSPFYNIPMAVAFRGRLDVPALAQTLGALRDRHESLRTTFVEFDERPLQTIGEAGDGAPLPLPVVDLSALGDEPRGRSERRLSRLLAAAPFDLARGPLLSARLLRLDAAEHLGLFTVHHIVSDGWSTGVLVREVAAIYEALVRGRRPNLPPPAFQYADFAAWQRGWLDGPALEAQVDWWRRHLDGAPATLDLPTDRPRPEVQSFRGGTRTRALPAAIAAGVADLARRQGATPFMVLLAAGGAVLSWWSGRDDLVLGSDIAGRNRPETEGIVGFFINQLALRVRLAGEPTFAELIARVRESTLGAFAHQDLPFDTLVERLNPERSLARSPIFSVKLNLNNMPLPPLALPGLEIAPRPVERKTAQFDWIWNVYEAEQGFLLAVEYAADLFDESTVDRLLADFEAFLTAALEEPERRLGALFEALDEADARERRLAQEREREAMRGRLKRIRRGGAGEAGEAR